MEQTTKGRRSASIPRQQGVNIADSALAVVVRGRSDSITSTVSLVEAPETSGEAICDPLQRFCEQYGEVAGYLRERDLNPPHPRVNHAWVAAGMVEKFGFYQPCMSFVQDRAAAIEEYEEECRREKEAEAVIQAFSREQEKENRRQVEATLADPESGLAIMRPAHILDPQPPSKMPTKDDVVAAYEKARDAAGTQVLALSRGYKAAQDIIASGVHSSMSARRGRRLMRKAERREKKEMLEDYLAAVKEQDPQATDMIDADGLENDSERETEDEGWLEVKTKADSKIATPNPERAGTADVELPQPFEDVEGSFAVDNGKTLVKQSSMRKLFEMVSGNS